MKIIFSGGCFNCKMQTKEGNHTQNRDSSVAGGEVLSLVCNRLKQPPKDVHLAGLGTWGCHLGERLFADQEFQLKWEGVAGTAPTARLSAHLQLQQSPLKGKQILVKNPIGLSSWGAHYTARLGRLGSF